MTMVLLLLLLCATPAYADCALSGNLVEPHTRTSFVEGGLVYDTADDVLKTCDGANWQPVGAGGGTLPTCGPNQILISDSSGNWQCSAGADPCLRFLNPAPGEVCNDGTVYAGTSGGNMIFATRCDEGQSWNGSACTGTRVTRQWKTANTATANTASLTDGLANTNAMIAAGAAAHPAGNACRTRGADWFLPAKDELNLLYINRTAGGMNGTFLGSATYWSASENNLSYAWRQVFSDGTQDFNLKNNALTVRCVRR